MYAVLVTGGKQYRVVQGETLRVEKLDVETGGDVTFNSVLLMGGSDGIHVGEALKMPLSLQRLWPMAAPVK